MLEQDRELWCHVVYHYLYRGERVCVTCVTHHKVGAVPTFPLLSEFVQIHKKPSDV